MRIVFIRNKSISFSILSYGNSYILFATQPGISDINLSNKSELYDQEDNSHNFSYLYILSMTNQSYYSHQVTKKQCGFGSRFPCAF